MKTSLLDLPVLKLSSLKKSKLVITNGQLLIIPAHICPCMWALQNTHVFGAVSCS